MRTVRASIEIAVEPARYVRAFLDPDDLRGWWRADRILIEPKLNGLYAIGWGVTEAGYQYVSTGTIVEFEPTRLRVDHFTYFNPHHGILGPMELCVTAEALGSGTCRATVEQSGYQHGEHWDWFYAAVTDGWPKTLDHLRRYLEHPDVPK
ncbi:MAG: SRPBCC domain-containing protein [Gemmatimonadaceae bacterium]